MCELQRNITYHSRRPSMAYHFTILFPFVSMLLHSTLATGHTARSKALTFLLRGLLACKQASLSGRGRGKAIIYAKKRCRGKEEKAQGLLRNDKLATGGTGAALFGNRTKDLQQNWVAV